MFNRYETFPTHQVTITPDDNVDISIVENVLIEAGSDGTIKTTDMYGNVVTRTVKAGTVLPCIIKRVWSTGTTVSPVIGLY